MKRIFLLLLVLCPFAAQAQNGGSVLSRFGIGELDNLAGARQRGMGYTGAAVGSSYEIHATNPAAWTFLSNLRLQAGGSYEYESSSKGAALSYGSFAFKSLDLAIPFEESMRTRLSAGLHQLSGIGYELNAHGSEGGKTYTSSYSGSGGLAFASIGMAVRPLPWLNIGAAARWYFGTAEHEMVVDFDDADYFTTTQRRSTSHGGGGYVLGAVLTGMDGLALSASVATTAELDASRDLHFQYATHDSTVRGADGIQDIPVRYQAGLSYELDSRLLIAADVAIQDWTGARVFGVVQPALTSGYRISAGAEWKTGSASSQGMLRASLLRFGVAHQKLSVLLDGVAQSETYGTVGFGFPVWAESRADLSLEAGVRGASSDLLGSRLMVRFSFSISVGENWFTRREAD